MKTTFILALSLLTFSFTSCKKEGCTSSGAKNYSDKSKKDDGSCIFESNLTFWYNQQTASSLQSDGVTSLTFYCNGKIVGSSSTSTFWTGSPDCGQTGVVEYSVDLKSSETSNVYYEVKDQNDIVQYSGNYSLTSNLCFTLQLD